MFEVADRLVGIYKTQNATKSVTINPKSMSVAAMKKPAKEPLGDSTNTPAVAVKRMK